MVSSLGSMQIAWLREVTQGTGNQMPSGMEEENETHDYNAFQAIRWQIDTLK